MCGAVLSFVVFKYEQRNCAKVGEVFNSTQTNKQTNKKPE